MTTCRNSQAKKKDTKAGSRNLRLYPLPTTTKKSIALPTANNHPGFTWCSSATQNAAVPAKVTNRLAPSSKRKSSFLLRFFLSSPMALTTQPRFQLGRQSVHEREVYASYEDVGCCLTYIWCSVCRRRTNRGHERQCRSCFGRVCRSGANHVVDLLHIPSCCWGGLPAWPKLSMERTSARQSQLV